VQPGTSRQEETTGTPRWCTCTALGRHGLEEAAAWQDRSQLTWRCEDADHPHPWRASASPRGAATDERDITTERRSLGWGEADTTTTQDLLTRARCLLFPVRWQEPFGIVLVEALACGTPVVALAGGAVAEVVTDGRTGLVAARPDDLPALLDQIGRIDPAACRQRAWRFDVAAMVAGHEAIYARLARAADGAAA
jgi:glycosyltransferase involved in cell wall biosynthesis